MNGSGFRMSFLVFWGPLFSLPVSDGAKRVHFRVSGLAFRVSGFVFRKIRRVEYGGTSTEYRAGLKQGFTKVFFDDTATREA